MENVGLFTTQSTPPPPSAAVSPGHAWAPPPTLHPHNRCSACKKAWAVAWLGPHEKVPEGKLTAVADYTSIVMTAAAAAAVDVAFAVAFADTGSAAAEEVQGSAVAEGLVVGFEKADIVVAAVAAAADTGTETDEEES